MKLLNSRVNHNLVNFTPLDIAEVLNGSYTDSNSPVDINFRKSLTYFPLLVL